jgi:uncharacterized MAPEG superfamily protein
MGIELKLLVWSVALAVIQMVVAVCGCTQEFGLPRLAGNREDLPDATGWAGRAQRAHRNMLESFVLFAALVLVAVAAQRTNSVTALGAELFFWARLVYAAIYLAGIPWARTVVWSVSVIGLAMIFSQVL